MTNNIKTIFPIISLDYDATRIPNQAPYDGDFYLLHDVSGSIKKCRYVHQDGKHVWQEPDGTQHPLDEFVYYSPLPYFEE